MITCIICNHSNRPNARFCANCAAPLTLQNKYHITRLLGRGGFGSVYLAEHLNLAGKCYAIKELVLDPSATPAERQQAESQFRLEATLLAKLDHPNLPKVWDFFSENDRHYLVMEYVEGETLEARLTRAGAPLPEADVLPWARELLDALAYLHAQKPPVIHRDVNPRNVKIAPDGKLKLIDFGIAKLFATGAGTSAAARAVSPPYSPMEQYGGGTDARSDIYALGATLYHLLTNHLPPDAPSRAIQSLTPPRQLNFALSDATEATILKAMAINAADRFQNAADMQAAMRPPTSVATVPASRASVVRNLLARFSTWLRRAQTPLWAVGITVLVLVLVESVLLLYVQSDVQSAQKAIQAQVTSIARADATATLQARNIEEAQRVMATQTAVIAQAQRAATAQADALVEAQRVMTVQAATVAEVRRTATAQAQAIPTIHALELRFADLALQATRVYNPASGRLDHKDDGAVKYTSAKVDLRDLIVEARFLNPYSHAEKPWDYGFAFRSVQNREYRLIITSLKQWELKLGDMVDGRFTSNVVAEGEVENLDVSASGVNSLRLFVKGGTAFLIVNGKHIATLDTSRRIVNGDVAIVTGFYGAAHQLSGRSTRYGGFTVWSLP